MSGEIGSEEWWLKDEIHGRYGIVHKIMNLVAGCHISPMKGVELVEALFRDRAAGRVHDKLAMSAPWEDA